MSDGKQQAAADQTASSHGQRLQHAFASKAGDALPPLDFIGLLLAGALSLWLYAPFLDPAISQLQSTDAMSRLVWIAALLAPFILYDPRFTEHVRWGQTSALLQGYLRRLMTLVGVVGVIAFAGDSLAHTPTAWIGLWLSGCVLISAATRVLLARYLQDLMRRGVLAAPALPLRSPVGLGGDGVTLTMLVDRPIRRWSAALKGGKDKLLALLLLLALLPVLACIALAIRFDSPGPVLFRQRRHGINNAEFDIYKFRTMRNDVPGVGAALQQTLRGDARITRVGAFLRKWSLDELPQVFNVLGGSMSLVGPRPHAVNMRTEAQLGYEITETYPHRHRVKPGITGWSQINGARGATDTVAQLRRRIELDLYYVDNWSILLDLKILSRTFREVLRATNAF